MNETKYYLIHFTCGCGEGWDFVEARDEEDATSMAYQGAIENYESYEGLHGIRGMAEIAEEDFGVEIGDVDYDTTLYADIETAYFEEKENTIDYWAEEVTYEQYIRQDETWQEGDDDE